MRSRQEQMLKLIFFAAVQCGGVRLSLW